MSTSIQREIGTTLAEQLAAYTFDGAITSVPAAYDRKFDFTFADLATRRVSIVPGPVQVGPDGNVPQAPRGADWFGVTLGIHVACRVASAQEIDDCEDLCQGIMDAIRSGHLDMGEGVDWLEPSMPMPFDPDALENRSVFLAQIVVTFTKALAKTAPPEPPEE